MAGDEVVDLYRMVEQWGQEFAIERELADSRATDDDGWLSLAEAEKRVGVSRSTLRAWYRSGQIASRLMPGPHGLQRLVPLNAVVERAARSPRTGVRAQAASRAEAKATSAAPGAPAPGVVDPVVLLAEIATAAATARALAAETRAAEAEAALHAALERAAGAEAELRLLRSVD